MDRESGATMIELIISLALISIVFLAAAPLIIHSIEVFQAAGRSLTDPSAMLAGSWLRRDIHAAQSIHAWRPAWSTDVLVLRTQNNELITYELDDAVLIRRRLQLDGQVIDRRVMLRGIARWRWRTIQDVVTMDFVLEKHLDPTMAVLVVDADRRRKKTPETESFCFSGRGGPGGRAW